MEIEIREALEALESAWTALEDARRVHTQAAAAVEQTKQDHRRVRENAWKSLVAAGAKGTTVVHRLKAYPVNDEPYSLIGMPVSSFSLEYSDIKSCAP